MRDSKVRMLFHPGTENCYGKVNHYRKGWAGTSSIAMLLSQSSSFHKSSAILFLSRIFGDEVCITSNCLMFLVLSKCINVISYKVRSLEHSSWPWRNDISWSYSIQAFSESGRHYLQVSLLEAPNRPKIEFQLGIHVKYWNPMVTIKTFNTFPNGIHWVSKSLSFKTWKISQIISHHRSPSRLSWWVKSSTSKSAWKSGYVSF